MKQIKKYRLIWNDNKELLMPPYDDYTGSETYVGDGINGFESDDIAEIENKIEEENLTYNETIF